MLSDIPNYKIHFDKSKLLFTFDYSKMIGLNEMF